MGSAWVSVRNAEDILLWIGVGKTSPSNGISSRSGGGGGERKEGRAGEAESEEIMYGSAALEKVCLTVSTPHLLPVSKGNHLVRSSLGSSMQQPQRQVPTEYENRGSPGSRFPDGTIGPAEEDFHGLCTPEPPPGPQMPGHPARAAQRS